MPPTQPPSAPTTTTDGYGIDAPIQEKSAVIQFLAQPQVASFLAGGAAGAVSRTIVSPVERMKILFQVQGPATGNSYQGMFPTLAKMWREEGWRGYMRGNWTNCIRIAPYSAVQFWSYNVFKTGMLEEGERELDTIRRLTAGGLAGVVSVVATYPLDITRTRISIASASIPSLELVRGTAKLPGMTTTMKQIYRNEGGIRGLYRGIVPTTLGVAPYVGLNFAVYEHLRSFFRPDGSQPSASEKLLSGAIAGGVAQTITYPADVLRRRFQVNTMKGIEYGYTGLGDAVRTIWRKEGIKGFYKGLGPNVLKVVPSMAASWMTYEWTVHTLMALDEA
ncbi:hypothetical protein YB2330_006294 [Saitoella coloradoensis]